MQIKLSQSKLANALNYTTKAVSVKPNIPVLANVLLEVTKNDLHIAATNLDMGINMWIPGQVTAEGSITASGKFLADFISATGEGMVELDLEKDTLKVVTDSARADFQTIPSPEFPVLPQVSGQPFLTVNAADFINALHKVIFACATDLITSRIQYTGVLFEFSAQNPQQLVLVGLDGFRLSRKLLTVAREGDQQLSLIIPARSLQEMVKIAQAEQIETIEMYMSENKSQVIFKLGEIEVSIRLLEGPYADYQKVLPQETSFGFSVPKLDLERAMKVVHTFARSTQGYRVDWDLDLEKATLTMQTSVADLGNNQTKIKVDDVVGSSDLKAAYSLQFLMDMIGHIEGATVQYATNGALAAAVFTDNADPDFMHIVMPLQRED